MMNNNKIKIIITFIYLLSYSNIDKLMNLLRKTNGDKFLFSIVLKNTIFIRKVNLYYP